MAGRSLILMWAALTLLHNFVASELNFEDQKNFFFPDPHATTPPPPPVLHPPPAVSYTPPPPAGGYSTPPPSHHGGGTPPAHCGNPPTGGGSHHTTPSPPTAGGYHHSPPTTPVTLTPPSTPTVTTPPSPPSPFDPMSPPFTCTYWRNHPTLILAVFGWWGTVGNAFGISGTPGVGAQATLLQALSNTRTDGYGELYREGTAALLNSMAHAKFPYSTTHVRDSFVAALSSNKAASAQAQLFNLANEGQIKGGRD